MQEQEGVLESIVKVIPITFEIFERIADDELQFNEEKAVMNSTGLINRYYAEAAYRSKQLSEEHPIKYNIHEFLYLLEIFMIDHKKYLKVRQGMKKVYDSVMKERQAKQEAKKP